MAVYIFLNYARRSDSIAALSEGQKGRYHGRYAGVIWKEERRMFGFLHLQKNWSEKLQLSEACHELQNEGDF